VTQILLVRHGQSTWNAAGRWQGRADPPLSPLGVTQARQAGRALGAVDVLVSSPLQRARSTAELIGDELGVGPVEVEHGLIERAVGPWTGLSFTEIETTWPGAIERREWPEGFEDDDELVSRAVGALQRLEERFDGLEVVAVTHGGVLHALERAYGLPAGRFSNLTGRRVVMEAGRVVLGDRVLLTDEPTGGARPELRHLGRWRETEQA
jgi:probable phosphoglycerate mutase